MVVEGREMIEKITQSPVVSVLGQAVHAANLRHNVISNNIANVNTPGFKKSEVVFESLLSEMLTPSTNKINLMRTQDKHLPMPRANQLAPQINAINSTTMRTDGNNVDIDEEMTTMAKNTIYYNATVRQIGEYFSGLKSIISGQK